MTNPSHSQSERQEGWQPDFVGGPGRSGVLLGASICPQLMVSSPGGVLTWWYLQLVVSPADGVPSWWEAAPEARPKV